MIVSLRPHLLARLRLDLEELCSSPYPGVEVIPNERDLRRMCLLLSPPAGPWKGLRLHFDVELPSNWVSIAELFLFNFILLISPICFSLPLLLRLRTASTASSTPISSEITSAVICSRSTFTLKKDILVATLRR